jgi:hypothetical protein
MTTVVDRPANGQLWSSMPGWGIVADLTPPELIQERRLATLRKMVVVALCVIALLVAAGYAVAFVKHSSASDVADRANAQTLQLQQAEDQYADVTQIEGTTAQMDAQIATLMTTDVDVATLVAKLRAALPNTMSINELTLSLTPPAPFSGGIETPGTADQIGTVTITGTGRTLNDLAGYVDTLTTLAGVTDVIPTSNVGTKGGTQFTVNLALTDQLYSHRFDSTPSGGN